MNATTDLLFGQDLFFLFKTKPSSNSEKTVTFNQQATDNKEQSLTKSI